MNPEITPLYLDDLEVGQRFTSGTYQIDKDRMKAFAAEFDPQPFHLDEAAAQDSVFQGLAASGWYTGWSSCQRARASQRSRPAR